MERGTKELGGKPSWGLNGWWRLTVVGEGRREMKQSPEDTGEAGREGEAVVVAGHEQSLRGWKQA